MAVTRTYVYNATSETNIKNIYDYLVANAVPKYFDSVVLSEDSTIISCYVGELELLKIHKTSYGGTAITVTTEYGTSQYASSNSGSVMARYIWKCSNGISIAIGDWWAVTITKDNDSNTVIIFTSNVTVSTTASNTIYALSAKVGNVNSITVNNNPDRMKTALCSFIVGDTTNYTPDVYLMPFAQSRAIGILDIDGVKYMTNGLWCVKDD